MYAFGSSAVACGPARYETASMNVGPSPAPRALDRLARRLVDGEHVACRPREAGHAVAGGLVGERLVPPSARSSGVEIAHWLLLQKRISGARITAAKFAPSWNAPSEVAPSPK